MKIEEVTKKQDKLVETAVTAMQLVNKLDTYIRAPVLHIFQTSNTESEIAQRLRKYLVDNYDDTIYQDRKDIERIIKMVLSSQ